VGTLLSLDSGALRIAWVTYQIFHSVTTTFSIEFPTPFSQLLSLLGITQVGTFQGLGVDCIVNLGFFGGIYATAAIPVIIAIVIVGLGAFRLFRASGRDARREEVARIISQHSNALLLESYCVLPTVSSTLLRALNCDYFKHNGSSYVQGDTSVSCETAAYSMFSTIDAVLIALYLSVPVMWAILLFRANQDIDLRAHGTMGERAASLKFLYGPYRPAYYLTEIVEM